MPTKRTCQRKGSQVPAVQTPRKLCDEMHGHGTTSGMWRANRSLGSTLRRLGSGPGATCLPHQILLGVHDVGPHDSFSLDVEIFLRELRPDVLGQSVVRGLHVEHPCYLLCPCNSWAASRARRLAQRGVPHRGIPPEKPLGMCHTVQQPRFCALPHHPTTPATPLARAIP